MDHARESCETMPENRVKSWRIERKIENKKKIKKECLYYNE